MGEWAAEIVTLNVPTIIRNTMFYDKMDSKQLMTHILSVEDQEYLRYALLDAMRDFQHAQQIEFKGNFCTNTFLSLSLYRSLLRQMSLSGFVRNGAILPRKSGASDEPMGETEAVPFRSPPSLEREFELPNSGKIRGMAIPHGVTLIVGGGFHGMLFIMNPYNILCCNHTI